MTDSKLLPCDLQPFLSTVCHSNKFIGFEGPIEESKKIDIIWRAIKRKPRPEEIERIQSVCQFHFHQLTVKFHANRKTKCFDPFLQHPLRKPRKHLTEISHDEAIQFHFKSRPNNPIIPGLFVCRLCRCKLTAPAFKVNSSRQSPTLTSENFKQASMDTQCQDEAKACEPKSFAVDQQEQVPVPGKSQCQQVLVPVPVPAEKSELSHMKGNTDNFFSAVQDFYNDGKFTDVVLSTRAEPQEEVIQFKAHSVILSAISPFLKDVLLDGWSASDPVCILLDGISGEALNNFLNVVYSCSSERGPTFPEIAKMFEAAEELFGYSEIQEENVKEQIGQHDELPDVFRISDQTLVTEHHNHEKEDLISSAVPAENIDIPEPGSNHSDGRKRLSQEFHADQSETNGSEIVYKETDGDTKVDEFEDVSMDDSTHSASDYDTLIEASMDDKSEIETEKGQSHSDEDNTNDLQNKTFDQHCNTNEQVSADTLSVSPVYHCQECDVRIEKAGELRTHMKTIHGRTGLFFCSDCPFFQKSKQCLNAHIISAHLKGEPFKCQVCEKTFCLKASLRIHAKRKHNLSVHILQKEKLSLNKCCGVSHSPTCCKCGKEFRSVSELNTHVKEKHEGTNICYICGKTFSAMRAVRKHIKLTHEGSACTCESCGKTFSNQIYLKRHIQREHSGNVKEFPCFSCGKLLRSRHALRSHTESVHLKLRPYSCDFCDKKCYKKSEIDLHIANMHSKIKNYPCEHCDKPFVSRAMCNQHIKQVHLKITPFQCSYCDKEFFNKHARHVHTVRSHTKVKDIKCSQCDSEFVTKSELEEHLRREHSDTKGKDFKCTQCGSSFVRNSNLKRHFRKFHADSQKQKAPTT